MGSFWPLTLKRSLARKGATADLPSSSMETPRTVKPFASYFCCISMSQGISMKQGSHQVAQKLTRTTLPLYWLSAASLPSRSLKVTSGAGVPADFPSACTVPLAGAFGLRRGALTPKKARGASHGTVARIKKIFFLFFSPHLPARPPQDERASDK